jgi:FkbM family methyltransferase
MVAEVFSQINLLGLNIDFVIEAGSHHGTDTLELLANNSIKKIFCFEPNPNSRAIFLKILLHIPLNRYFLFNAGLSNENKKARLFLPRIDLGGFASHEAGTSSLSESWAHSDGSGFEIDLVRLDDLFSEDYEKYFADIEHSQGLLWLDVEGNSLKALEGMKETLKRISVAKIELEYARQPGQWETRNIFEIIRLMFRAGFLPYSGYLHPLSRGDMFFVKKSIVGFKAILHSLRFSILLILFHGVIYPSRNIFRKGIKRILGANHDS